MFTGTHMPRLDDKGRVILPAKFREHLAGGLVFTKGQDRCISVWPKPVFDKYAAELRSAPLTTEKARAFVRVFFSSAFAETPDKQGRVTVPGPLREYAGISRDVVVIGTDSRAEIWDAEVWQAYLSAREPEFADFDGEVVPHF